MTMVLMIQVGGSNRGPGLFRLRSRKAGRAKQHHAHRNGIPDSSIIAIVSLVETIFDDLCIFSV